MAMIGRWARSRWSAGLSALGLAISLAGGALLAARPAAAQTGVTSAESEWRADLDAWRARREKEIDAPDGWLTLVGLEWLKSGANSVGAAADNQIQLHAHAPEHIGMITVSGTTVQLLATMDGYPPGLMIDGKPAKDGPLTVEGAKPSIITWHGLTLVVLDRGGRYVLRVKDADSDTRKGFHGLNWFAPDPNLSIQASWIPFTPPHVEAIPTVLGTTLNLPAPGVATFTVNGQKFTLEPVLESPGDKTLFFIVSDQTLKSTTYQGGRFLHVPFPDHGLDQPGTVILDFNRLENPPCAYTSYATCPLPPEKNRMPVAIEAGEKRYAP
jgi:uncharacterized protein (DUF1684 family)